MVEVRCLCHLLAQVQDAGAVSWYPEGPRYCYGVLLYGGGGGGLLSQIIIWVPPIESLHFTI